MGGSRWESEESEQGCSKWGYTEKDTWSPASSPWGARMLDMTFVAAISVGFPSASPQPPHSTDFLLIVVLHFIASYNFSELESKVGENQILA